MSGQHLVFLIDEPEMHLHPQLQSKLFEHLESSGAQTLVSSHSPLFLNLAKWRGITRFTKEGTYPTARKLKEKLGAQSIHQHLDDISRWYYHETTLSPQDNEMFFARRILLVEGPAEKYGLPRIADTLSKELPDLTIISCNGKSKIPHYATLCQAFEIPTFVLFDLDGEPTTEAENQTIFDSAKGLDIVYFDTSFEAVLGVRANAKHKASKMLARIDSITRMEEVPQEIAAAVEIITEWCAKV
jgi:CRISPR-associated exonuclease Cas4